MSEYPLTHPDARGLAVPDSVTPTLIAEAAAAPAKAAVDGLSAEAVPIPDQITADGERVAKWETTRRIEDAAEFEAARDLSPGGLDEEITLLRSRIKLLLDAEPANFELLTKGLNTLARLAITHFHLNKTQGNQLTEAMTTMIEEIRQVMEMEGDPA